MKLPNILSLLCLSLGFAALAAVANQMWETAFRLVLLAAAADAWAGRQALGRGRATPIGAELDALAGLMSFGVAPVVFVYNLTFNEWQPAGWIFSAGLVLICAFRLARDNSDRPEWPRYRGLPVPIFGVCTTTAGMLVHDPLQLMLLVGWLGLMVALRLPYGRLGAGRGPSRLMPALLAGVALLPVMHWLWFLLLAGGLIYTLAGPSNFFGRRVTNHTPPA